MHGTLYSPGQNFAKMQPSFEAQMQWMHYCVVGIQRGRVRGRWMILCEGSGGGGGGVGGNA